MKKYNLDLSGYNVPHDMLPTKPEERNWNIYSFFALWIGMDIGIPTYMLASGLIEGGMNLKWAMITILLANIIIAFPIMLNGHAGAKYGIPSTVYWRSAFGFNGASVAAVLRGIVAAGWCGIQFWIGGNALNVALSILIPAWGNWALGKWVCFVVFLLLNLYILINGLGAIKKMEHLCAPMLIIWLIVMLIWARTTAGSWGPMVNAKMTFATTAEFVAFFVVSLNSNISYWCSMPLTIQFWIGGNALNVALSILIPAWGNWALGKWVCFVVFLLLNLYILINGLGAIKKMEHLCAPMLIIWLIVMLIWARTTAGSWGPMVNAKMTFATTAEFVAFFVVSLNSNISYWCSMPLTVTDFTKAAKDQRSQEVGQLLGIPTGMFLLALVGALVSSCTIVIFGHVITDPVALTSMIGHPALIVGMMLFLIIATLTTNVAANALTPAVAIVHLTNGKLNFKWAAVVLCAIGVAIRPWVLINDMGLYMNFFLNGGGALLGPVVGVTICHYFFVCRTELDVRSLYVPEGESMFLNIKKYNKPTYIIIWAMSAIMLLIAQLAPASWQTATCTLGCSMRFSMNAMAIICIALGYLVFRKREGGINSLSYLTLAISFVIIFLGLWVPVAHWLYDASFIVGTLLGLGIYVLLMRVCDKDFMVKKAAEHKAAKAEEANA